MIKRYGFAAGALLLMSATSVSGVAAQTPGATAELKTPSGETVGHATFSEADDGVMLKADVMGLPAGEHGIHVHGVGKCDPPDFTSAGGHFNPESKQHGLENPMGAHAGDMPNLTVGSDGTGSFEFVLKGVTLDSGTDSLFGPEGTALVVHAGPDDEKTDPSGNSGGRIACGVIMKAGGTAPAAQAAPAAQPSPAAKPAAPAAAQPAPAAKPAPAQAPAPIASPAALPRTGVAGVPLDASLPTALAGIGAVLGGLALWRRRR
jgi:Cu-Zn family superoxide dismutase